MSNQINKDKFAKNAAHKLVFYGIDLDVLWRDDLYPDFEKWRDAVSQHIAVWQMWKINLAMQKYKVGDYVVIAMRCTDPNDSDPEAATIHFFGQILEIPYQQENWALFKTFDGEGNCQRQYTDCLVLNEAQANMMLNSQRITCDELGLP